MPTVPAPVVVATVEARLRRWSACVVGPPRTPSCVGQAVPGTFAPPDPAHSATVAVGRAAHRGTVGPLPDVLDAHPVHDTCEEFHVRVQGQLLGGVGAPIILFRGIAGVVSAVEGALMDLSIPRVGEVKLLGSVDTVASAVVILVLVVENLGVASECNLQLLGSVDRVAVALRQGVPPPVIIRLPPLAAARHVVREQGFFCLSSEIGGSQKMAACLMAGAGSTKR
mmetsp:Transcript_11973/g.29058  ORF Transcript_11973/g.29058 Transcript_11973/m.29058 type:complete len:225 (-) Transcript_11973:90-764(-)